MLSTPGNAHAPSKALLHRAQRQSINRCLLSRSTLLLWLQKPTHKLSLLHIRPLASLCSAPDFDLLPSNDRVMSRYQFVHETGPNKLLHTLLVLVWIYVVNPLIYRSWIIIFACYNVDMRSWVMAILLSNQHRRISNSSAFTWLIPEYWYQVGVWCT